MELTPILIVLLTFVVGTIAPKPPAPRYAVASSTSNSITISITPPSISDLKGYRLQYSEAGGKKLLKEVGKVTEYTLGGLKPDTAYRFRIQTRSGSGTGKYGGWVNGATVSDAPPAPEPTDPPPPPAPVIPEAPQNLAADPMTTSATVSWEAPVDNGAEITGYRLTYGTVDNPAANTVNLDPAPTQTQLDGLMDNTEYSISLLAYNADGESPPVSANFQTLQGKLPPPPVENLQTMPKETAIEVTWTLPATTTANAIEGITVIFGEEGTSPDNLQTSNFEGNTVRFTAEGLSPGTRYTVAVFTVNQQGQSEPVAATAETIMPTMAPTDPPPPPTTPPPLPDVPIPDTPRNLRATSITEISARLVWEKPVDNGAEIRGYVLAYGPMTDPTANTQQLNPSPTQYDLYGLRTNIQYSVYITAYNQVGQSRPAEIEFWTSTGRSPPPPVDNVQSYPAETSVYITWSLPPTDERNEIETVRLGFGPYGTSVDYLPFVNLDWNTQSYTAERLAPGTSFTAAIITQNSEGDSTPVMFTFQTHRAAPVATRPPPPDKGYEGDTPPAPIALTATVISPTTIRVDFTDPTLQGRTSIVDERYYRLRYKKEEDRNFQYMNIRETPYTLEYLTPESTYQIDVKLVIDREAESPFTEAAYAFTGENVVRDVTAIQLLVTGPGRVDAIINWIPPENQPRQITGYAVEYAAGYYVTSRSEFLRQVVDGNVPRATLHNLAGDTTYHVRVAPRFGSGIGRFSDPPDAFLTPPIPVAGQPLFCGGPETPDQIRERVTWMRGRAGMIGVPLPYCDDYYGVHECHGSVCFCIPGSAPPGSKPCARGAGGGLYGDDPNAYATTAPCDAEYEATLEAIDLASKTGKPLVEARLPYCTKDGYYQSKQCLGSMCYCATKEGKHTGKEVPIWEAQTLVC